MSVFQYLQLQPVDPQDDGTISELDSYLEDDTIDLSGDASGEELMQSWDSIVQSLHGDERE